MKKTWPKKISAFNYTKTYTRSILIKDYPYGKAKNLKAFTEKVTPKQKYNKI